MRTIAYFGSRVAACSQGTCNQRRLRRRLKRAPPLNLRPGHGANGAARPVHVMRKPTHLPPPRGSCNRNRRFIPKRRSRPRPFIPLALPLLLSLALPRRQDRSKRQNQHRPYCHRPYLRPPYLHRPSRHQSDLRSGQHRFSMSTRTKASAAKRTCCTRKSDRSTLRRQQSACRPSSGWTIPSRVSPGRR